MYQIKVSGHFDAAHFLAGYQGKCRNLHGHRWKVEVWVQSQALSSEAQTRDMVMDFSDLKERLRELCSGFDHTLIYETGSLRETTRQALEEDGFALCEVDFRPTAEAFARFFFDVLRKNCSLVCRTAVYETPENAAFYEEP